MKRVVPKAFTRRFTSSMDGSLVRLGVQEQVFPFFCQWPTTQRKMGLRSDIKASRKKNQSFLERNEHQLDYLYAKAREGYRARSKELHPDNGGSHEEFVALNRIWEYVKRKFKAWGVE